MFRLFPLLLITCCAVLLSGCDAPPDKVPAPVLKVAEPVIQIAVPVAKPSGFDYTLDTKGISAESTYTDSHKRWTESLVRNIGHRGDVHVFMAASVHPTGINSEQAGKAFVESGNRNQILVHQSNDQYVVIDLNRQEVGTMGTNGLSLHPHPDGRMIVCLNPVPAHGILGVCLSDTYKTQSPTPLFEDGTVSWTWGAGGQ